MQIRVIDKNFEDLCYKSISFLEERVAAYLNNEFNIENPWFVDSIGGTLEHSIIEREEIVLFGSFLQRFLESGCWEFKEARFWVLSKQVKNILVELVGISSDYIRVIPREAIVHQKSLKKINKDKEINLVYSGRLSESKNLISVIYTAYYLQKAKGFNFNLSLFGDFDNVSSIYSTKEDIFNFKKEVLTIIEELDWETEPLFMGELGTDEWIKKLPDNSILINFSNYICEDFGVSVAQALEAGIPCILSDWGGFIDYKEPGFLKIPINLISDEVGNNRLLKPRAKKISELILNKWDVKDNKKIESKKEEFIYFNKKELDEIRSKFIQRWGYESLFLLRGQANKFFALEKGKRFFKIFTELFSTNKSEMPDKIILISKEIIRDRLLLENAVKEIEDSLRCGEFVECEKIEKAMWKTTISKILNASEIVFSHYAKELDSLIDFIGEIKKESTLIKVYTAKGEVPQVKTKVKIVEI